MIFIKVNKTFQNCSIHFTLRIGIIRSKAFWYCDYYRQFPYHSNLHFYNNVQMNLQVKLASKS